MRSASPQASSVRPVLQVPGVVPRNKAGRFQLLQIFRDASVLVTREQALDGRHFLRARTQDFQDPFIELAVTQCPSGVVNMHIVDLHFNYEVQAVVFRESSGLFRH
jgi:hypothetical protein